MITRNEVFSRIATALRAEFSDRNIYITGERIYAPEQLPCVWLVEIDGAPIERYTNLDLSDEQKRSTFEVQVFSNKSVGASLEAEEIASKVASEFRKIGYLCTLYEPFDNGFDASIKRHVSRYTRVIGGGETLPTTEN